MKCTVGYKHTVNRKHAQLMALDGTTHTKSRLMLVVTAHEPKA